MPNTVLRACSSQRAFRAAVGARDGLGPLHSQGLEASPVNTLSAGLTKLREAVTKANTFEPGGVQDLQFLAGVISGNAHAAGHQLDTNTTAGTGLWPVLSMLNHSCNPNVAHTSDGELRVRHPAPCLACSCQVRAITRLNTVASSCTACLALAAACCQGCVMLSQD